jgi:hypothetical protein
VGLAQGTLPYCSKYAYIYRPDEQVLGGKKEIQIEFKLILERKAVDIGLEPEDTLYIPEATAKKNWLTAADKITAFGTATVSGVLIWGVAR